MSSWRLILALVISTLVTCLMFAEALVVRPNFYSACISLTQSNSKKSVLLATILTHIFCARKLLMRIFYGELRAVEEQHTGEKLWYSGTEILFAIAVFHKELSQVHYASIFTFVWLVKSLHWVAEDRVDLLFTTGESDWAHVRYLSTLTVLCATDVYLLNSFYPHIDFDFSKFSTGVEQGIWVILALEIGLVLNSIALCHNKYLISMRERYFLRQNPNDETWTHKKDWLFAAEAASDLIQIAMFCIFFVLISSSHGMPIFKFRDAVVSVLNLVSRVKGYYNYRVLTRQVDSFTTTPSEDDLARNQTCIICFEDMELVEEPKQLVPNKLSCGHVLHNGCLKHWLERSKLCPTCRRNVFTAPEVVATLPWPRLHKSQFPWLRSLQITPRGWSRLCSHKAALPLSRHQTTLMPTTSSSSDKVPLRRVCMTRGKSFRPGETTKTRWSCVWEREDGPFLKLSISI
uniref:Hrd1 protein n=1 Tax=Yarrowia lipolytica TaxID=4952 RepID=Q7ZA17_YARLL|nr:Hrd1 protein [Yarrowia lipolytica]